MICPLDGEGSWYRVYKGKDCNFTLRGMSVAKDAVLRVCAFNKKGCGEWSETCRLRVLSKKSGQQELNELPPSWFSVDIDDIIQSEKLEGEALRGAMAGLFSAVHKHRSAIKLAFRYYEIVGGSNNTKDDASDAMTSLQFVGFAKVSAVEPRTYPTHRAWLSGCFI